jgi:hypothetical protein
MTPGQQMPSSKIFMLAFGLLALATLGLGSTSFSMISLALNDQNCVGVSGNLYADIKENIGLQVPGELYILVNTGLPHLVHSLCAHNEADNIILLPHHVANYAKLIL